MSRTALVVDDSKSIRQMVAFTLKQAGFDVLEGENGKEGLEQLDKQAVDLVVTDLNMPVVDGITFIRELRGRAAAKFVPVLFLTTESQESKKADAKAAGATGWMVKPFHPDQLLSIISKIVR